MHVYENYPLLLGVYCTERNAMKDGGYYVN